MIVVIPSSREITLNNLSPLIDIGSRFIIVDDSIEQPFFCKSVFDGWVILFPWSGRSAGFPIHH